MKYLLDTDHISILQKQSGTEFAVLSARLQQEPPSDLAFCIVSFHEQTLGCHAYLNAAANRAALIRGYAMLDRVLDAFAAAQVLPFDTAAASALDNLAARGVRLAAMDARIAAIALARGLTLLTRNLRDFGKVPGLVVEDWTK